MYIVYYLHIDFLKLYMPTVSFVFRFHFKVCYFPLSQWKMKRLQLQKPHQMFSLKLEFMSPYNYSHTWSKGFI